MLVLDNYDSFTWNLVQALEAEGARCVVYRSDAVDVAAICAIGATRIVLSPGPFGPAQTGVCADVVRALGCKVPILGVCLGMQVIAMVAGAAVRPCGHPVHGKAFEIFHEGRGVLAGLPSPFAGARYHSLQVDPETVPEALEITARTADGTIMGCRLAGSLAEGVMFHPESFLTEHGPDVLRNFLRDADVV